MHISDCHLCGVRMKFVKKYLLSYAGATTLAGAAGVASIGGEGDGGAATDAGADGGETTEVGGAAGDADGGLECGL